MKEYKWGRIMTADAIGLMIGWGTSIIPNRRYISLEIPFLIIQIYISKHKKKTIMKIEGVNPETWKDKVDDSLERQAK